MIFTYRRNSDHFFLKFLFLFFMQKNEHFWGMMKWIFWGVITKLNYFRGSLYTFQGLSLSSKYGIGISFLEGGGLIWSKQ